MSTVAKARQVGELTRAVHVLALAGLRQRHPGADDRELFLRLAAMRLGRETMVEVYGWDPLGQRP
jgi:hypothetical protein